MNVTIMVDLCWKGILWKGGETSQHPRLPGYLNGQFHHCMWNPTFSQPSVSSQMEEWVRANREKAGEVSWFRPFKFSVCGCKHLYVTHLNIIFFNEHSFFSPTPLYWNTTCHLRKTWADHNCFSIRRKNENFQPEWKKMIWVDTFWIQGKETWFHMVCKSAYCWEYNMPVCPKCAVLS